MSIRRPTNNCIFMVLKAAAQKALKRAFAYGVLVCKQRRGSIMRVRLLKRLRAGLHKSLSRVTLKALGRIGLKLVLLVLAPGVNQVFFLVAVSSLLLSMIGGAQQVAHCAGHDNQGPHYNRTQSANAPAEDEEDNFASSTESSVPFGVADTRSAWPRRPMQAFDEERVYKHYLFGFMEKLPKWEFTSRGARAQWATVLTSENSTRDLGGNGPFGVFINGKVLCGDYQSRVLLNLHQHRELVNTPVAVEMTAESAARLTTGFERLRLLVRLYRRNMCSWLSGTWAVAGLHGGGRATPVVDAHHRPFWDFVPSDQMGHLLAYPELEAFYNHLWTFRSMALSLESTLTASSLFRDETLSSHIERNRVGPFYALRDQLYSALKQQLAGEEGDPTIPHVDIWGPIKWPLSPHRVSAALKGGCDSVTLELLANQDVAALLIL